MAESGEVTMSEKAPRRLANWDLPRAVSMFAVVVVHMSGYLGPIGGVPTNAIGTFAIVCDPVFFALSGYFALRPLKTSLPKYYVRKFSSIILPLFLYSALLYVYYSWSSGLSLFGYIEYFNNVLTPWWFIPALIPYLIAAPFLYKCLESLSDDWVKLLVRFSVVLSIWGIAGCFLTWAFEVTGHATLGRMVGICTSLLPATLVPNSYFIYFCLGFFIRRLIPILSDRRKKQLMVLGLSCWLLDAAFAHFGINRVDPSYAWLPATIAIFLIFDRLSIPDGIASRCIGWAAKRSYSIYLLQYTTIEIATAAIYTSIFAGGIMGHAALVRLCVWLGTTLLAYVLAFGCASIVDSALLRPLQGLVESSLLRLQKASARNN